MLKKPQIQNPQFRISTVRIELERDRRFRKIGSESGNRGMIFGKSHISSFHLKSTVTERSKKINGAESKNGGMIFEKSHISDIRFPSQINSHRELKEDQ